ncbi:uncharacterized protein LOC129774008 [Toxorhynchites rutilus septentrionalis]|uniref:uncharacterized protein LOC129774008 n=1 Tax=Toxorhynchites rutilus septentrionalis TaxID=329112 RepID=UPI00247878ED|nr:uncharacterized protein LOC129774008 [Toxorhynchites rutilus septentrionalis]
MGMKSLIDSTPIEIIFHPTLNQRKCVVSCWDVVFMPEDELLTELSEQKVIGVKRIFRYDPIKKEKVATSTLILTIKGTVIPEAINFGFIRAPTRNYYPSPMQCFGCYNYEHTSKKCMKKIQLCRNCGVAHPELNQTDKDKTKNFQCNAPASCVNCKGNHSSTSRKCPAWIAEDKITRVRIDEGISYKEAKSICENNYGSSFASKLKERLDNIQNTGCQQCKCNCTQTKSAPIKSNKTVSIQANKKSEQGFSIIPIDSEEDSESPMEIESTYSNNRKIISKTTTSDEFKSSEDEQPIEKESSRKKPKSKKSTPTLQKTQSHQNYLSQPSTSTQPIGSNPPTTQHKPNPTTNKPIANVSKNDTRLKPKHSKGEKPNHN